MLKMVQEDVRLAAKADSAEDAIRQAADVLAANGAIEPDYVESMLTREKAATTYLGNGLAIPHGCPEAAAKIRQTRVAVLQLPDGVEWTNGKTVRLVFAVAARSDEHIELLRRLTGIVGDGALADKLATTVDPADILSAVETPPDKKEVGREADAAFDGSERKIHFTNPRGFHLRPAGRFARAVKEYPGDVTLVVNHREIVPDSPTLILNMGIGNGDTVCVRVKGENETDTLSRLAAMVVEVNNEPQEEGEILSAAGVNWEGARENVKEIKGIMASPGLAVAPVCKWNPVMPETAERVTGDAAAELADLNSALDVARSQLRALTKGDLNEVQRGLFEAHAALLDDEGLSGMAETLVRKGGDALAAWNTAISAEAEKIEALGHENLMQRAVDLRDVGQRVEKILLGLGGGFFDGVEKPVIFAAEDLQPSDAAQLDVSLVRGICLKKGTPNAHAAIVARSLGIPMLVAVGEALDALDDGATVVLDASGGRIVADPDAADIASAQKAVEEFSVLRNREMDRRFEPALLKDGHRVEVAANIGQVSDVACVIDSGAEGVGLLRTEFLFLDRAKAPDEEEQYAALREMVEALQGLPMIVRTLDIGGDKPVDYLGLSGQDLSFLGLRGFRLAMARPDLAKAQLRAVYRAAEHGPVRLMFPMIATVNDFCRAREMAEKVRREISGPEIELGIMIEVPSAAALASDLAEHADFFSVGTNDLTQYTLAADRTHPLLAQRADSLHPAVLRLVDMTVKAAREKGKWVGVCGALAADPPGALVLAGLGIDELSMPAAAVSGIKALLRRQNRSDLHALAQKALVQRDARAVRALCPVN